ncbi:MAG: D-cysteine desulfhydrase [Rhodospirillales bacterium]|nr:D-cysteine desulfhydrase [Rhodospirillales bacterium]
MHLSRYPRAQLCHRPTPLEPLDRLSKLLGGPKLLVKRDDCTGLAIGGNKTRKLEFLMGEALQQGADTVITLGATQSNHVRQTAAAAARLGLKCEVLLERRIEGAGTDYEENGNVLLDRLLDARIHSVPGGADMKAEAEAVAGKVRARGGKPYIIPGGGSNTVGALGYVDAAMELVTQANDAGIKIDAVVHGSGSTGTQAGLVAGLQGMNSGIRVIGISVSKPRQTMEQAVFELTEATADFLGIKGGIARDSVEVNSDYVGPGYGRPTDGMKEAVTLMARQEGILLDPVYTGKAMAGLIDYCRRGLFGKKDTVVFLHTGGSPGLFAYRSQLAGL